jgi:hypothetical protein
MQEKERITDPMQPINVDMIVQEILTDMSLKDKAAIANTGPSSDPGLDTVFEELTRDDDETSKAVLRKIWEELHETYRIRRVK